MPYIYAVSCIAAGLVYFICCLDAYVLRDKYSEWERPYKAPGGKVLFILGMIVSVWIIIGSCLEMPLGGYISLAIYSAIGFVIYYLVESYRKKHPENFKLITLTPEDKDNFN